MLISRPVNDLCDAMTPNSLTALPGYCLFLLLWLPPGLSAVESSQGASSEPEEVSSGYLEARPGYIGSILGVQIDRVLDSQDPQSQIIQMNVPIAPDRVGSVQVFTPTGELIQQPHDVGIKRNYENNSVDIRIHLPKNRELGFRLKLIGETDKFED